MYRCFLKRFLDMTISAVAIVVSALPMLIISIAIKCDSQGPVLFKQKRVGAHKRHFTILKFRTMRIDTPHDEPTHLLKNPETYITKVGRFLRKTSLDELPQLFNIFVGHMSIVGPRPALWNQFDLIEARDAFGANDLRPGLTGWAQVNGRDALGIEAKATKDGEYARGWGFLLDCRCVFGTFSALKQHRATAGDSADEVEKPQEIVSQK